MQLKEVKKQDNHISISSSQLYSSIRYQSSNNTKNVLSLNQKNRNLRKKFSKDEDDLLKSLVKKYGPGNWNIVSSYMSHRSPHQCRDRYRNYLKPGFFNGEWTIDEDIILMENFLKLGPQWSLIAKSVPSRSPNSIKNRWHYFLSKKYLQKDAIKETLNETTNTNLLYKETNEFDKEKDISLTQEDNIIDWSFVEFEFVSNTNDIFNFEDFIL